MWRVLLIPCVVAMAAVLAAPEVFAGDYGETTWGMSPASVKAVVKNMTLLQEGPESLLYSGDVAVVPAEIAFRFHNSRLEEVVILFKRTYGKTDTELEAAAKADDYGKVVALISGQYGNPLRSGANSLRPGSEEYCSRGNAEKMACVSFKKISLSSLWETGDTRIVAQLTGEDERIVLRIRYSDKNSDSRHTPTGTGGL